MNRPLEIEVAAGVYARVDEEDYERVRDLPAMFSNKLSWQVHTRNGRRLAVLVLTSSGKYERVYLHHVVLGMICDKSKARVRFLNGNTLDCRKENLAFSKRHSKHSSEIEYREPSKTWASYISFSPTMLGIFATEDEALAARTEAHASVTKLLSELKVRFGQQAPQVVKVELEDLVKSIRANLQKEKEANPYFGLGQKK
jgi:hypothetical protein